MKPQAAAHGDLSKQQLDDVDEKPKVTDTLPLSAQRPTITLAADPTYDPEDPLRRKNEANSDKFDSTSSSENDTNLGDIADIRHASICPPETGSKKLNTAHTVIIFMTNEIGIGILSLPSALNTLGFFPGIVWNIISTAMTPANRFDSKAHLEGK